MDSQFANPSSSIVSNKGNSTIRSDSQKRKHSLGIDFIVLFLIETREQNSKEFLFISINKWNGNILRDLHSENANYFTILTLGAITIYKE